YIYIYIYIYYYQDQKTTATIIATKHFCRTTKKGYSIPTMGGEIV
ncbi:MAG: hypothetical protein ACI90V_005247, partial [Bacillariaceae sp.]